VFAKYRTVGPSPGIAARLAELDRWLNGRFAELVRVLDSHVPDRSVELARAWQERAVGATPRIRRLLIDVASLDVVRQPCLRDARPEHFLFEADSLTGLVDFGAMGIESVAADLGRLVAEWLSDDPELRAEALASYMAIRPLDTQEMVLISVFETSARLLIGGRWAAWHFLEGRVFNDPSAVTRGLEKGVERIGLLQV
jgi:homoserine kinase type II